MDLELDLESKVQRLKSFAERESVDLPDEVARYIALTVPGDARDLSRDIERSFIKLVAYASLTNQEITLPLAQEVLGDIWDQWVH
jgi:chromosomal replication initiator protein